MSAGPRLPIGALATPPRVSILVVCKDAAATIRRCIESLVHQDYPHLDVVVQDGASTDGTLEILAEYGDRLQVVSEPDADQNEGFVKGLRRCAGDVVGFCWADEELLPHAASFAVRELAAAPELGGLYGAFIATDLDGRGSEVVTYAEWDFARVYRYEFIPPVCASFFRRDVLAATYLRMWDVSLECSEYVLWMSVGSRHPIRRYLEPLAKYARHPGQLSMRPARVSAYPAKLVAAMTRLAARPDMPSETRALQARACANAHLWAAQWLLQECALLDESRMHLATGLDYGPDTGWVSTVLWNCFRLLLGAGAPAEVLRWVDLLAVREVPMVGAAYAQTLALRALGRQDEADAAEERMREERWPRQLLRAVPELVRTYEMAGRHAEADACLAVFWRLGVDAPRTWIGLVRVLAELERYPEAFAALARHRAAFPDDPEGAAVAIQLALCACLKQEEAHPALGGAPGRALPVAHRLRVADGLWRAVADPGVVAHLSPGGCAALERSLAVVAGRAQALGYADLLARLARVADALVARTAPPPRAASA